MGMPVFIVALLLVASGAAAGARRGPVARIWNPYRSVEGGRGCAMQEILYASAHRLDLAGGRGHGEREAFTIEVFNAHGERVVRAGIDNPLRKVMRGVLEDDAQGFDAGGGKRRE